MGGDNQTVLFIIVAASAALQAAAAVVALSLNRFTTRRHGWILISLAIFCMAFRRLLELHSLTIGHADVSSTNLWQETTALLTSALMLAGLVLLRDMFRGMQGSHEALLRSEKRYREIFEQSNDGIVVSDLEGKVQNMNLAGRKMFGISLEGPIDVRVTDYYLDLSDRETLVSIIAQYGFCRDFAVRMKKSTGQVMECELSSCLRIDGEDRSNGYLTIVRDATRRRRAEAELREKTNTLDAITASSPVGIFLVNDEKVAWVNPATVTILGASGKQIMGMHPKDFWARPEDYKGTATRAFKEMTTMGSSVVEAEMKRADGSHFDAFIQLRSLDAAAPEKGYIGCISDVTESKRAAEKIRKSKARYRLVLENANVATFILQGGKIQFCNEKACELLGMPQNELTNKPWRSLVGELCAKSLERDIEPIIRAGAKFGPREHRVDLVSGRQLLLDLTVTLVEHEQQTVILVFAQDMTTQRRLERQLQQAQKMEALGRLAAGVAHDFNNLIMVVENYSQILLMHRDCTADIAGFSNEIQAACTRALNLTEKLSMFSRQEITPPNLLNINGVINDMYGMVKPLLNSEVKFETDLAPNLWNVLGDRGEMEQVLMNLAVNANDAMENGGILTISTANYNTDNNEVAGSSEIPPGKYVLLSVRDTGVGIDTETAAHIFEPFFSTKRMGKGTGLGLSIVYGIVKKLDGQISVDSLPGRGTMMKVFIPKAEDAAVLPGDHIQVSAVSVNGT